MSSHTLPTAIAEVVIYWAVVGTAFESIFKYKSKKLKSIILTATISTILFGAYHFAHSPPFNQPNMVLFIMYPGVLTSIIYFIWPDIYAAIIFHNFQALFGVMGGITYRFIIFPTCVSYYTKVDINSTSVHAIT